jgi:hypothetical protein
LTAWILKKSSRREGMKWSAIDRQKVSS